MKCADCRCLPEDCVFSISARVCTNCSLEECCCWYAINKR